MLNKNAIGCLLALFIVIGCKKEINSEVVSYSCASNLSLAPHGVKDTLGRWFGTYSSMFRDPDAPPDTVSENVLIKNGQAAAPYDKDNLNTSIGYNLPPDQGLTGDSIAFEASVKDDSDIVQLDVMGTEGVASVKYVNGSNNTGTITISVGNINQSKQVNSIDFTSFKTIAVVLKGAHAYCYVSNKLILSLNYAGSIHVGVLKTLSIGNNYHSIINGSSENRNTACNYIRIYNSYSKRLLMKEDFNIDGRSNTIFY